MDSEQRLCIRCDEPVAGKSRFDHDADWTVVTWNQETAGYPIHESCRDEIAGRNLWRR